MPKVLSFLLLLVVLMGCTQAPQPFRHERTGVDTSGLRLRDGGTVQILAMEGTSIPMGQILTRSLADSLAVRNIPATSKRLHNPTYKVRGQVILDRNAQPSEKLGSIYWTFMDRTNTVIHESSQEIVGQKYQWDYGDQDLIDDLVEPAADLFAGYLQDASEKEAVERDPMDRPVVFVLGDIKGTRGDGAQALHKAMGLTLRQFGAKVRSQGDADSYYLSCEVDILPAFEGKERIKIAWIVQDAEANELGRAQQDNQLDEGVLDGKWGRLAYNISRAAMPGIGQIVERDRAEKAFEASREQIGTSAAPGRRSRLSIPPF